MIHLPYCPHHRVSPIRGLKLSIHIILETVRGFLNLNDVMLQHMRAQRPLQFPPAFCMKSESDKEARLAPAPWVTQ